MVVVGVDEHKRTPTFVAVNETGRRLSSITVTALGHAGTAMWGREHFIEEVWENGERQHLSAHLEHDLLSFHTKVVQVRLEGIPQKRASAHVPTASHDEDLHDFQVRVDRPQLLITKRMATIKRLLWRLHKLAIGQSSAARPAYEARNHRLFGVWPDAQSGHLAGLGRRELARISRLAEAVNLVDRRIDARSCLGLDTTGPARLQRAGGGQAYRRTCQVHRLQELGHLHPPRRRGTGAGVIRLPRSRVQMTRSGNRQLNSQVRRIAVSQLPPRRQGPDLDRP